VNETDLLEDRAATAESTGDGPSSAAADSGNRPTRRRASRPAGDGEAGTGQTEKPRGSGLTGKLLPELQQIASDLGIAGTAKMRKGQLIAAIQEARTGGSSTPPSADAGQSNGSASKSDAPASEDVAAESLPTRSNDDENSSGGQGNDGESRPRRRSTYEERQRAREERAARGEGPNDNQGGNSNSGNNQGNRNQGNQGGNQGNRNTQQNNQGGNRNNNDDDDDDYGSGRSRRGRYRDRRRGRDRQGGGGGQNDTEPVIREDDVLAPVAGILDAADNYAFLRTSGYLAGPNDVYVSMNLVRRHGLRRGDAITGVVRANASESDNQGSRREKYTPLVRLDTVNGVTPEEAKNRPDFTKLVPLYPQERLRLETDSTDIVTRVIDLVMPIGKGQRALIVSPPKAGKTTVLQRIANAITENNPECHLMVVLVDERPEEVTDMQRSVKGEVIASTFDRPAQDHTTVAELSIERAKRLVELGHDVVVLLDSITRLGRAYNLAAPASGRILSGGVDSTALYPPKRFLGAARNIENGGSLTILATALVETGSMMDTVIFEEFKGTGNAELKLDRKIADKRVFPAVDIDQSSTRKDELLMSAEEMQIMIKLRRVLHSLDSQASIELLISKLKETRTNIEFLMQIAKTAPGE
jgi:transcription termination factor Rho